MSRDVAEWHVSDGLLADYEAGRLAPAAVMSMEAHLARCSRCRAGLPADPDWLAGAWERLAAAVSRPPLTLAERVLCRAGVPEHLARLLAATPTLSRAWLAAVVATLGFAVLFAAATDPTGPGRLLPFLLVAPVLPVAGIGLAYGRWVDPAYELLAATSLAGARLLLVRASAVLVVSLLPAGFASFLLPGSPLLAVAWLLPALTLTTALLALATRLPVPVAATGLATAWVVGVLAAGLLSGERLLAFGPAAQTGYAFAVGLLASLVYVRRRYLDPGEPRWRILST